MGSTPHDCQFWSVGCSSPGQRGEIARAVLLFLFFGALAVGPGCTTLGPMPAMTALNPVPEQRTGVEVQAGFVPGFFLSDTVQEAPDPSRNPMPQLSVLFDPGELLAVRGLSLGARYVGGDDSHGIVEPMLRYRFFVDDDERFALGFVGFGTYATGSADGTSYTAIRVGLETSTDIRLTPKYRWIELHLNAGAAMTVIHAEGDYCTDPAGFGDACEGHHTPDTHAEVTGAYGTLFIGAYLDFFRHTDWSIHPVRLGIVMAGGTMPQIRMGEQEDTDGSWYSIGLNLITGFGAAESTGEARARSRAR